MNYLMKYRSMLVVGMTVGFVAIILFSVYVNMYQRYERYQNEVDRMQLRISRFIGLAESEADFVQENQKLDGYLSRFFYKADMDEITAENTFQRKMSELFQQMGVSVSGSQILPAVKSERYTKLKLDITLTVSMEELKFALEAIKEVSPIVVVEQIAIQPNRAGRGDVDQTLTVKMNLYTLRRLS